MTKLIAGIKLIRPINGMVASLSLIAASAVGCGVIEFPRTAAIAVFFLVSFGYAINDIFDLRADRINRPGRALPSGALSRNEGWLIAVAMLALGLVASILDGWTLTLYYLIVSGCLVAYATGLSGVLIVSNALVALLCSSVFILAALLCRGHQPNWRAALAATLLTFLFNLVREIIKDIQDVAGDKAIGRDTLAIRYGANRARLTAGFFGLALILLSYASFSGFSESPRYLWTVSVAVNLPLAAIFVIYFRADPVGSAARVSVALKVLMLPALMALASGGVK